ncbi:MAG: hypothetical protein HFI07_03230 [Lachnospiraceae bacterium]|nr:hypothetical protein [Lachnospiraceae bacterium]
MNLIEKFVKTSAIYLFGKIATYIVSFLMLRYYTSNIVPAEYGQYEYIISIVDVVVPVLFIELWSGILRFGMEGDYGKKTEVISTAVFMLIPATLLYVLLYVIIIVIFSMKLYAPALIYAGLLMLVNVLMRISRILGKNKLFAASGLIGALFNAVAGYICVHFFGMQCDALMFAMIGSYSVQAVLLCVGTGVWRYINISEYSKTEAKRMAVYCFPFALNTILHYINTNYYKSVVKVHLGNDVLGLFSVSTKFCVLITFVVSVFHMSWQEMTYSLSEESDRKKVYGKGLSVLTEIVLVGTLLLLPVLKIIFPIFIGSGYSDAAVYIPAYYSTVYFSSIAGFIYNTLTAENITVFHPITKLITAVINLLLIYTLIDKLGIFAIIIAAVISGMAEMSVLMIVAAKKIYIPVDFAHTALFIILYIAESVIYIMSGTFVNVLLSVMVMAAAVLFFGFRYKDILIAFKEKYFRR